MKITNMEQKKPQTITKVKQFHLNLSGPLATYKAVILNKFNIMAKIIKQYIDNKKCS